MALEKVDLDMQNAQDKPLVAVWMLAYNHAEYIQQAVEGVMTQKTNFNVRLFLSEDCSPDSTREICINLANKYGDRIDLYLPEENVGVVGEDNLAIRTYKRCFESGADYVALCEGDDYWTDENKLQKQIDFLESNPEYALSCHNAQILHQNNGEKELFNKKNIERIDIELLLNEWVIPTASVVFRNNKATLPEFFYASTHGDLTLYLMLIQKGKFKYFNFPGCVYRKHDQGIMNSFKGIDFNNKQIDYFKRLDEYLNFMYQSIIRFKISKLMLSNSYWYLTINDKKAASKEVVKAIRAHYSAITKGAYYLLACLLPLRFNTLLKLFGRGSE